MIKLNKSINQSKKSCLRIPGLYHYSHSFSGVRVAQSLVFCIVFLRSSFVCVLFLFTIVFWLTFFNLQILITPLVSSNFSYSVTKIYKFYMFLLQNWITSVSTLHKITLLSHFYTKYTYLDSIPPLPPELHL
jgi:hypothetical protein